MKSYNLLSQNNGRNCYNSQMITALLAIFIIILSIAGMSIGLILKNKPLQPSCGGIYLEKGDTCKVCGKTAD